MKSKALVLAIALLLLGSSAYSFGKERRGAEVIVNKHDGTQIKGELFAAKRTSLLLLESQSGADLSVNVGEINNITIVRKSKALLGAGIGAVSGVILFLPWRKMGVLLWGALSGFLEGAGIGAIASADRTYQIENQSQEEIERILRILRTKARIPNPD